MDGLLAQTVLKIPEGRHRYRARVAELTSNLFRVDALTNRVNELGAIVGSALGARHANARREYSNQVIKLRSQIVQRFANLEKQLGVPEPNSLQFQDSIASLGFEAWRPSDSKVTANLDQAKGPDARRVLHIRANTNTIASWRKLVRLPAGNYRLEGAARTAGVEGFQDKKGEGAGLRISGTQEPRVQKLVGDTQWTTLAYEFEVPSPFDDVDLVCELRALKGDVWFDVESLRLVRLNRN